MASSHPIQSIRYNPFKPGSPVGPGMFSGRGGEILALEKALFQTKHGNPLHFLVTGERGIGKSSLLTYLQVIAKGNLESVQSGTFKFLVVSVELDPSNDYGQIIKKLGAELQRVVASEQQARELAKNAWEFLTRWEIFGVKYRAEEREPKPHELLEDLTHTVQHLVDETKSKYNGVLFLIDEADKPHSSANLGEFVKLFTERLAKRGCDYVSVGMAGLPTVLRKLKESHESAPRIFQVLNLEPLAPEERVQVVRRGLTIANEKNDVETKIAENGENLISGLSEGYPHFIQQFAYCAFESDTDNFIDPNDVIDGAFKETVGAFQQLGLKYFEDLYFEKIWSDEYREVLRVMARYLDEWVDKKTIRKEAGLRESTLTNALAALKKRSIIIPRKGKKGVYRLPSRSFAVWIKAFTAAAPRNGRTSSTPA